MCLFQKTATECLIDKLARATDVFFKQKYPEGKHMVGCGRVAGNGYLRQQLERLAESKGADFAAPPVRWVYRQWRYDAQAGFGRLPPVPDDPAFSCCVPRRPPLDETRRKQGAEAQKHETGDRNYRNLDVSQLPSGAECELCYSNAFYPAVGDRLMAQSTDNDGQPVTRPNCW